MVERGRIMYKLKFELSKQNQGDFLKYWLGSMMITSLFWCEMLFEMGNDNEVPIQLQNI